MRRIGYVLTLINHKRGHLLTFCLDVPLDYSRHRRDGAACVDEVHGSKTQPALPIMTHRCCGQAYSLVENNGKATEVLLQACGVVATKMIGGTACAGTLRCIRMWVYQIL